MPNKVVRDKVIAFRLTVGQYAAFLEKLAEQPVVGAKSPGLMARKMALDFTGDELTWKSKKKRLLAPEVYMAAQTASAATA
jgi:antibiotic biosynthesis monooxygenase (ABM) superfamily enzyme